MSQVMRLLNLDSTSGSDDGSNIEAGVSEYSPELKSDTYHQPALFALVLAGVFCYLMATDNVYRTVSLVLILFAIAWFSHRIKQPQGDQRRQLSAEKSLDDPRRKRRKEKQEEEKKKKYKRARRKAAKKQLPQSRNRFHKSKKVNNT
jgi:hypothetical protein